MSIFADKNTKVVIQGITGGQGRNHAQKMLDYGTDIVAGTSPGKGGQSVLGIPVFDSVREAVEKTGANTSVIMVPPPFAADAILEAIDAEIALCVCITEHIPVNDMLLVKRRLSESNTRLIGPNCPGMMVPGSCKLGIMPSEIHMPGHIGIVSRSGSLTFEAIKAMSDIGLGQSTTVGIGGDPIRGTSFLDTVKAFNDDPDTLGVVMIGEIGGNDEEKTAAWIKENMTKPVVAFICGRTAPKGKRMGHAGAVVSGRSGTADEKIKTLESCGVPVAETSDKINEFLVKGLKAAGVYEACLTK